MMNQTDIKYILGLLNNATESRDWDDVLDVIESLKEFLDEENYPDEI